MSERWLPVPGWEGYYEVSDHGRVKSLARSPEGRPGVRLNLREKVLRGYNIHGYPKVSLCRDNRRTHFFIHHLVLLAFVGPRPEGYDGCHNDGDPSNNRLENLRWDTRSNNMRDAVRHGTHQASRKTHCKRGHEFTESNTYITAQGYRQCRACRAAWARDHKETA